MRLFLRYYREGSFGGQSCTFFNLYSNSTVGDFLDQILLRLKLDQEDQTMEIKNKQCTLNLDEPETLLSEYGIKTGTYFNLDTQSKEQESTTSSLVEGGEHEKERGLRYSVKPGLRKQSKQGSIDEKHLSSLEEIIRIVSDNPDSVKEFEEAYRQLPVQVNLEELGSKGYGCLHAACSIGNSSLVDFLLRKKKLDPNAPR